MALLTPILGRFYTIGQYNRVIFSAKSPWIDKNYDYVNPHELIEVTP